jgi:nicotinate-nucleotide adenylyltransferase
MSMQRAIALLGGTFDPVHIGHLRAAIELREQFALDEVRLVPASMPPHRATPSVDSGARRRMVELAIADEPGLALDDRELRREGPSYSIDTLIETRAEVGGDCAVALALGEDAFAALDSWHRWRELLDYAHLVVMRRPQARLPQQGPVAALLQEHGAPATVLRECAHGAIVTLPLPPLTVSATAIRACIAAGRSPRYLLPDVVRNYIRERGLYCALAG